MHSTIFLADTIIVSELARPRPNPGVLAWASTVDSVSLSAITSEEIAYGLAWKPYPRVRAWMDEFIASRCDVLPVTAAIASRAGQLRGQLTARGLVRTQADMLIAATAQVHALTVVTRNVRDFEDCLIPILNPFT
jgi:predicted nucleic acid-binding protein